MRRIEKTVFISYRRSVSTAWALAIFHELTRRGYDVFFDYQGIASGDFEQAILENLRARAHFLILLGPGSLARCQQPGDWLRREIETAIQTQRNIVPLFFDGFSFGGPETTEHLTSHLAPLTRYNGIRIYPDFFTEAVERLCQKHLNVALHEVRHPISDFAQRVAKAQQLAAAAEAVAPPRIVLPNEPMRPSWASASGQDDYGQWAEFSVKGVVQRMRWIKPGEFWMGSPKSEPERSDDETQHHVTLTQGFWLADTACTQALWRAVTLNNPSQFDDDLQCPVEHVSWDDVMQQFLPKLNALVPGLQAKLPTEAQWEYACRAGTETPFWFGTQINTDQVNYDGNHPMPGGPKSDYRQRTVPVKALPANGWGLYQMHGNVREWCADGLRTYETREVTDPRGPEGQERVLRGGSWISGARLCRSALRRAHGPGFRYRIIGFRLSRGLPAQGAEP